MTAALSLGELWHRLREGGDAPFILTDASTTSFAEFRTMVVAAMAAYRSASLSQGDRVALFLPDEKQASAAFLAAIFAGHVPVMISADTPPARLVAICTVVEAARLVLPDGIARPGFPCPTLELAGSIHGATKEGEFAESGLIRSPDDLAYIFFTSGTTSDPSGVEITIGGLLAHLFTIRRVFDFGPTTRIFNPVPISNPDGIVLGPLLALAAGGSVVRPGPFDVGDVENWLQGIQRLGATHMVTNPTVLSLIERLGSQSDYFSAPAFRGILSSASQLSRERWERFEQRFETEIWNLYGLTETVTTALYAGRHPEMGAVGTIGRPIDCEARLGNSKGEPLSSGDAQEGEIQLRGDHIFRSYWRNPERTNQTFTADGWMRTGDLARRHSDGSYEFLGRLKAAINSGGTLIRGEEIDEALLRHPMVLEAVTVGLNDEDFEEIAVSAVVLSKPVDEAALTDHCRIELEALKVPKRIFAVQSIPRGQSGKPRLAEMRRMLEVLARAAPLGKLAQSSSIEQQVIDLAAQVFRVEPSGLSMASSPETVSAWDSFTHINLILQAESDFGQRIATRYVKSIKTLGDLALVVQQLRVI